LEASVFFNRRRKWNGAVASLLPNFDLSIEMFGAFGLLEMLDLVYPKGFSHEEAALYVAYSTYPSFLAEDLAKAQMLKRRIASAEEKWLKAGRLNPRNVDAWRKLAAEKEADVARRRQ
jgi:hypothetical protein